jgi:hypothetical protein
MARVFGDHVSSDELARFRELWMSRVGAILSGDPARVLELSSMTETL